MFVVTKHLLQRRKRSSSSSSCYDDFVKRLQNHAAMFKKHLTTQLFQKKKKKKLHLVLDLDHTLLHSVLVSDLSKREKYLLEETDSRQDLWRRNVDGYEFIIKLRPFLHEFLLEANKLFTMHVYTMGSSSYAKQVLKLIDPDKVYFGKRVITREASPFNKSLDLLAADKRSVDGTKWDSYAEAKKDESQSNGSLANVLKFLEVVHKRFEEDLGFKDLRLLIPCRQRCY
ncbi:unnamed protein product [Arabidopsis thaliana]|uniref:protein-serine/threonine phosphatase n=1 Tax=Arabidopsis thaliana TaxID=3702 RepID=A0A654EFU9_ARATH|nr:unnamed protein product [Arabidopsis thaliana]